MDVVETILTRRSIRKYKKTNIPNQKIKKLLEVAMSAPSARNTQSWQYIIIKNRDKLNEITNFHPYSDMLKEANLAILICGDKKLEVHDGYLVQNCSASTENILIAAHSLGLGAVWLGIYPRKERIRKIKEIFKIPDYILPISLISIGYPAEKKSKENRLDSSKIHYDKW